VTRRAAKDWTAPSARTIEQAKSHCLRTHAVFFRESSNPQIVFQIDVLRIGISSQKRFWHEQACGKSVRLDLL
jgi:hypothetical protein